MHLRIWFKHNDEEVNTGILIGGDNIFNVRDDNGKFYRVSYTNIIKSEWVNHPENSN